MGVTLERIPFCRTHLAIPKRLSPMWFDIFVFSFERHPYYH